MSEVNTVAKLHEYLGGLMEKEGLANEPVMFDTDGRTFNYHMALVGRAYFNTEPYPHVQLCEEARSDNEDERLRRIEVMAAAGKLDPLVASDISWLCRQIHECSRVLGAATNQLTPMKAIVDAAISLRSSGYDGPFIGEPVAPLFKAITEFERKEK